MKNKVVLLFVYVLKLNKHTKYRYLCKNLIWLEESVLKMFVLLLSVRVIYGSGFWRAKSMWKHGQMRNFFYVSIPRKGCSKTPS
jgi:hypothetical protein